MFAKYNGFWFYHVLLALVNSTWLYLLFGLAVCPLFVGVAVEGKKNIPGNVYFISCIAWVIVKAELSLRGDDRKSKNFRLCNKIQITIFNFLHFRCTIFKDNIDSPVLNLISYPRGYPKSFFTCCLFLI